MAAIFGSNDDIGWFEWSAPQGIKFDVEDAFLAVNAIERLTVIEKMLSLGLITVEQAMEMVFVLQLS